LLQAHNQLVKYLGYRFMGLF